MTGGLTQIPLLLIALLIACPTYAARPDLLKKIWGLPRPGSNPGPGQAIRYIPALDAGDAAPIPGPDSRHILRYQLTIA